MAKRKKGQKEQTVGGNYYTQKVKIDQHGHY